MTLMMGQGVVIPVTLMGRCCHPCYIDGGRCCHPCYIDPCYINRAAIPVTLMGMVLPSLEIDEERCCHTCYIDGGRCCHPCYINRESVAISVTLMGKGVAIPVTLTREGVAIPVTLLGEMLSSLLH